MANSVYDPETQDEQRQRPSNTDPRDNQPAGDSSDPRGEGPDTLDRSGLRQAEKITGTGGGPSFNYQASAKKGAATGSSGSFKFNPTGDSTSGGSKGLSAAGTTATSGALQAAESGMTGVASGGLYNNSDQKGGRSKRLARALRDNRKKALIGGGATAGIVGIIIGGIMLLIPLKIEHMVQNLQNRFFATSEEATEEMTQKLFTRYITKKVLPAYKRCGSTISKNCTPQNFGDGPVGQLYRTWSSARLENTLAEQHGIEFQRKGNTWIVKAPGLDTQGVDIGDDGNGFNQLSDRRSARQAFKVALNNSLENETKWKSMMMRYKAGRLLEGKYGLKRCIMFCGTRDALADKKEARVRAAQIYLVNRVVSPRSASTGLMLECMLTPTCQPEKTEPKAIGDEPGAPTQAENPDTDTKQRELMVRIGEQFPGEAGEKIIKEAELWSTKGAQRVLLEKAFAKFGISRFASTAANLLPIAGEIKLAADIISFADRAGPAVNKIGYLTNSTAAASLFMMYRTYADEIHTGHVNATEVGSMVTSLGPGDHGPESDPIKGGTASAEGTPLYQDMFGGSSSKVTLLDSVFPSTYAASSNESNEYLCNNGQPVPAGKLVCQEEVLGQGNEILNTTHEFLNQPFIAPLTNAANGISGIIGTVADIFGDVIKYFPAANFVLTKASDLTSQVLDPFFKSVIELLIPNPFGSNMSGGRTFDMMAAGADVAGNDYAHFGLGGQVLTDQQVAQIVDENRSEAEYNFANQSLFARLFDTDSDRSLVSKMAMGVPFGKQAAAQSGLANMLNPLGAMSHSFGSILSGKVDAEAKPSPFGVTQYGYPEGSIPDDPEVYWDAHCSDKSEQDYLNDAEFAAAPGGKGWTGQAASEPPSDKTGMPLNRSVNPCLLIKATAGSAGGYMDSSNLTDYDLADQRSGAVNLEETLVSGDAQELAKQILDNPNINLSDASFCRYCEQDIKNTAAGKPAYGSVQIDIKLLQFLAELGSRTKIDVNSITGEGSGHSDGSNHYSGHAVDFECGFNEKIADEVGKKYGYMANNERCDNGVNHSHYSPDGY